METSGFKTSGALRLRLRMCVNMGWSGSWESQPETGSAVLDWIKTATYSTEARMCLWMEVYARQNAACRDTTALQHAAQRALACIHPLPYDALPLALPSHSGRPILSTRLLVAHLFACSPAGWPDTGTPPASTLVPLILTLALDEPSFLLLSEKI